MDIMRRSSSLVAILYPIMAYSYDSLFNCMTVGKSLDLIMTLT